MKITQEVASVLEFVPSTIAEIIKKIQDEVKLSDDDAHQLRLILEEALTNGIQHGNNLDTSLKVTISVEFEDDTLKIIVSDRGEGFDYNNIPDPIKDEELKSFGRGIYLIKKMADDVTFNDTGSEITIIKKIS